MTPQQESALFHHSLGEAISYWAFVEMDLRHLASACGQDDSRHLLAVGFLSIENFRSKLTYCDNIVTERFHSSPHYPRWEALRDRTDALSRKRNRLAHHTVMFFPNSRPARRYALINWAKETYTAPTRARVYKAGDVAPPSDAMCLGDLVGAKLEFEEHSRHLWNVRAALLGQPERLATVGPAKPIKAPSAASLLKSLKASLNAK